MSSRDKGVMQICAKGLITNFSTLNGFAAEGARGGVTAQSSGA